MKRWETRTWLVRGAIATALLVPLLLWLSGCWLFNVAPVAAFTVRATIIEVGESLAFSAILSSDEDGIIAKFEWDFGDGGSATGESVTHTYAATGQYTVVLRVTDDRGATATAQKVITVNPSSDDSGGGGPGPTATFTATPLTGQSPLTVTFNASASSYVGHAITAYFWDFGDGTTGTGMTTTHTYGPTTTRTYNVVLRIIASDNSEDTATKSVTVTVAGSAPAEDNPTASFTTAPNKVIAPKRITCDGSNSDAVAGRTLTEWIWRFGDGTSPQSKNNDDPVYHRYVTKKASETFTITLIVVDDEDGTDTEQRDVVIENKQPVAGFEIHEDLDAVTQPVETDPGWVADDVEFTGLTVQTGGHTVWIQSKKLPTSWRINDPTPGTDPDADIVSKTGSPTDYSDHNFSYDPEGQGWINGDPYIPTGWPNTGWGIDWYKVDWGDGTTEFYKAGDTNGDGIVEEQTLGGFAADHNYEWTSGTVDRDITVTAIDYLGAETDLTRTITLRQ